MPFTSDAMTKALADLSGKLGAASAGLLGKLDAVADAQAGGDKTVFDAAVADLRTGLSTLGPHADAVVQLASAVGGLPVAATAASDESAGGTARTGKGGKAG